MLFPIYPQYIPNFRVRVGLFRFITCCCGSCFHVYSEIATHIWCTKKFGTYWEQFWSMLGMFGGVYREMIGIVDQTRTPQYPQFIPNLPQYIPKFSVRVELCIFETCCCVTCFHVYSEIATTYGAPRNLEFIGNRFGTCWGCLGPCIAK